MAKTLTGIVTSSKRDRTITVTVTSRETHPIYGKQYTINRKYQAHDEKKTSFIIEFKYFKEDKKDFEKERVESLKAVTINDF